MDVLYGHTSAVLLVYSDSMIVRWGEVVVLKSGVFGRT